MRAPSTTARLAPRRARLLASLLGAAAAGAVLAAPAAAVIQPAVTIDGPSENIVSFGGVAMAEDGTGGVVYTRRVEGVAHVFVSRFVGGKWLAPQRVDTEDHYAASWPRIGAASGGELVVIWATPFATESGKPVQELLSSTLGPGSSTFGSPTVVDPNIREGTGTSPDLSMSTTGQADVVYRVVEKPGSTALLRPGDVSEQVRVAHFDLERWSDLGAINRDPGVSMRPPTEANAPKIAVGPTGAGVVVWQEPEISGVARIWARRIYGEALNYVMPASASLDRLLADQRRRRRPQRGLLAARAGRGGLPPAGRPRLPPAGTARLPEHPSRRRIGQRRRVQGREHHRQLRLGGKSATVGRPAIDIDERLDMRALYDSNGQPRVIKGTDLGLTGTLSLGSPFVGSSLTPADELTAASVMNPEGGGLSAWPSASASGAPAVAIREDFPEGAVQTGLVSGGAGGPIGELAVAGSGLGDGLLAFQQGSLGDAAIVASQVSAPPAAFALQGPKVWIKPSQALIEWQPAPSANPPVTYSVVLDGHLVPTPPSALALALNPRGLGDGIHQVQVLATDSQGEQTLTAPISLRIDGRPPVVKVAASRRRPQVTVRVTDKQSGVAYLLGQGQPATAATPRGTPTVSHTYRPSAAPI